MQDLSSMFGSGAVKLLKKYNKYRDTDNPYRDTNPQNTKILSVGRRYSFLDKLCILNINVQWGFKWQLSNTKYPGITHKFIYNENKVCFLTNKCH